MSKVMDALEAVIVSAGVNAADKAKVQALLQATQGSSDADLEFQPAGAPDPAAYKSQSGGILSVLEDMLEKAKAAAEEAKATAEGELETASKNLADDETHLKDLQQECMTAAEEAKATAEGELETASKNLADDE